MAQKENPISNRLGYIKGWEANWYAKNPKQALLEDITIRKIFHTALGRIISRIFIERTTSVNVIVITVHSSKPGLLIGPSGKKIQEFKNKIKKKIKKDVTINVVESNTPELNARLIAKNIADQIEARGSYKRAAKRAIESAQRLGAGGIKIYISGRVGGVEIARSTKFSKGRIPTQTFRADISFATEEAHTTYGVIGVKVWVFKHLVYGKRTITLDEPSSNRNRSNKDRMKGRKK